jgi:hypothetical protein
MNRVVRSVVGAVMLMGLTISPALAIGVGDITFGGIIDPSVNLGTTGSLPFKFTLVTSVTAGSTLDATVNVGDVASFTPLTFDPFAPGSTLWSVGGVTLTLQTLQVDQQDQLGLIIRGTGQFAGSFGTADAVWSLSADRTNGTVAFSSVASDHVAVTPESSSMIYLLLGIGLVAAGRFTRAQ